MSNDATRAFHNTNPWGLSEFSEGIRLMNERHEAEAVARFAKIRDELPARVAALKTMEHDELLTRLVEFYGSRGDPRETELRQAYYDAIRTEVMRRLRLLPLVDDDV